MFGTRDENYWSNVVVDYNVDVKDVSRYYEQEARVKREDSRSFAAKTEMASAE